MTVVDTKHLARHLDEKKADGACNESQMQVAFADFIMLNKQVGVATPPCPARHLTTPAACAQDLVTSAESAALERRVRTINKTAQVERTTNSRIDLSKILRIQAFDVARVTGVDMVAGIGEGAGAGGGDSAAVAGGDADLHHHEEAVGTVLVSCKGCALDEKKVGTLPLGVQRHRQA